MTLTFEVMGPGVAGECVDSKDGAHIREDHFRPEIIDPFDESRVRNDGEPGELVFTSLTKEALPIIRYRTHDLTVKIERREDTSAADCLAAAAELRRRIKIQVGSSCAVHVAEPGTPARSSGKLRRIYDLRTRNAGLLPG